MDARDPKQRDPMYKAFRGHALKKQWQAPSNERSVEVFKTYDPYYDPYGHTDADDNE